ncbi:MAG TPA: type II toxin-antitoxin system RelE/ParE family toxin [Thermoanaerobaculia bacterium]|nr:type II toxin-antitoxin system RelE/ParE family toxin [Thermoanaerobaculia bacterium]
MSLTFSFAPEAREELLETIRYYESESTGLGAAFLASVNEGIQQILTFPESAPVLRGKVRSKTLRRFPYSLLYSIQEEDIRIVAVMSQKRRPFYWRGRK